MYIFGVQLLSLIDDNRLLMKEDKKEKIADGDELFYTACYYILVVFHVSSFLSHVHQDS